MYRCQLAGTSFARHMLQPPSGLLLPSVNAAAARSHKLRNQRPSQSRARTSRPITIDRTTHRLTSMR